MDSDRAHHPTPWRQNETSILDAAGASVATAQHAIDSERIVAAVNAVAGIPTVLLREGIVRKLINKHADSLLAENPELSGLLGPSEIH